MNRRSFFSFLAAVPVGVATGAANAGPPYSMKLERSKNIGPALFPPEMMEAAADREEMKLAFEAKIPVEAYHHPDWHIMGRKTYTTPATMRYIPEWDKGNYYFASVTDEPFWTRTAVKAGWGRCEGFDVKRAWLETGLPCVMFARRVPWGEES